MGQCRAGAASFTRSIALSAAGAGAGARAGAGRKGRVWQGKDMSLCAGLKWQASQGERRRRGCVLPTPDSGQLLGAGVVHTTQLPRSTAPLLLCAHRHHARHPCTSPARTWQEAVCDVAVAQHRGLHQGGVADLDAVVELVALPQAAQDGDGVGHAGLVHKHLLEAPADRMAQGQGAWRGQGGAGCVVGSQVGGGGWEMRWRC